MTDLDRLRRLYESIHDSTTNGAPSPVVVERADALIAALGDEIAELTGQNIDLEVWRASAVKRAEQAEAEARKWKSTAQGLAEELSNRSVEWFIENGGDEADGWSPAQFLARYQPEEEEG